MKNNKKNGTEAENIDKVFVEDDGLGSAFSDGGSDVGSAFDSSSSNDETKLFTEDEKQELENLNIKKKKKLPVILCTIAVLTVLSVGGAFAAPTVFLKFGDSVMAKGDYEKAAVFYKMCFNSDESKKRLVVADAVALLGKEEADEAINLLLENGISVNVKYNLDGGEFVNRDREKEVTLNSKDEFGDFYKAKKENYTFEKWDVSDFAYTPEFNAEEFKLSLKAHFELTEYRLAYADLFTEENTQNIDLNPATYNFETETITLKNPVRVGYDFMGWTGTDIANEASFTVVIPQGSVGNRAFSANWKAKDYKVVFEPDVECDIENIITVTYHKEYNFPKEDKVKRKGYKLLGWRDSKSDDKSNQPYVSNEQLTVLEKGNSNDKGKYKEYKKYQNDITPEYGFNGVWSDINDVTLSPDWRYIVYSIQKDLAGGVYSGVDVDPKTYTVNDNDIVISVPSRHGYDFAGWNCKWDGNGEKEHQINVVIPKGSVGNISLTAKWAGHKHVVVLNSNGGSVSSKELAVTFGSSYTLPVPVKVGNTFAGWYEGSKQYTGGEWNEDRNVELTAKWIKNTYDVTFNANGGNVSKRNDRITFDTSYTLPVPSRTGYTFAGWIDETGARYEQSGVWKKPGNTSLTAQWVGNKYIVSLNANGGSSVGNVNVTYGSAYTLPTPVKAGHTFDGWYSGSTKYALTGTWNKDSNISLVAAWTINTYKATLNANGGSVSSYGFNCKYGAYYTLPTPSRTGYTFNGWYNGTTRITNGNWWWTTDIALTANWTANKYTVSLYSNGGSGTPGSLSVTYGTTYSIPTPSKTGHTFNGWYNGSSKYASTGTWNKEGNVSLTASWTPNTYTATLNVDGGSVSSKTISCKYGSGYSLPTPTKKGYTFKGWYYGSYSYSSGTWNWDSNVTFKAKWEANDYRVSFDANGGYVSKSSMYVTYGKEYTFPEPTRKGYDFKGWYSGGTKYASSGEWDTADSVYVSAKWEIAKYDITLNSTGGEVSKKKITVQYGGYYSLPDANRDGYTFLGWYEGNSKYPMSGYYNNYEDTTLKAKWEANEYTVYLDPNGGNVSRTQMYVTYGDEYDLPKPQREGYKFEGWYSGSKKFSGGKWSYDDDVFLTAKWEIETYSIKLDLNGGKAGKSSITGLTYGEAYSLPEPTRTGYSFEGWYYNDRFFPSQGTFNYTSNITVEAEWNAYTSNVILDYDIAGDIDSVVFTYGEKYKLPTPKLDGYRFVGWYDENGKKISNDGVWKNTASSCRLTAKWKEK